MAEDFDKLIKDKLSEIQPEFQEVEWLKLSDNLRHVTPAARFKYWLTGSVAAATITATVFLFFQYHGLKQEVARLSQKTKDIENQINHPVLPETRDKEISQSSTKNIVNEKSGSIDNTNTLSLKNTGVENKNADTKSMNSAHFSPAKIQNSNHSVKSGINNGNNSLAQKFDSEKSVSNSIITNNDKNILANSIQENSINNNQNNVPSPSAQQKTEINSIKDEIANSTNNSTVINDNVITKKINQNKLLALDQVTPLSVSGQHKIQSKEQYLDLPSAITLPLDKVKEKNRVHHPFYVMAGGTTSLRSDSRLFGVNFQIPVKSGFSLTLGVLHGADDISITRDTMEFNHHHHHGSDQIHIDNFIPHGSPSPHDIKDISFKKVVLQLPVNIQYRFSLGKNFGLLCNAGSYLNLNQKSSCTYSFKNDPGNPGEGYQQRSSNINDSKKKMFDEITFGVGMEYQYKRIVLQAAPFYQINLANLKGANVGVPGIRLNAMYKIGG